MDFLLVRLGYRYSQMLNVSGKTGHITAQVDVSQLETRESGKTSRCDDIANWTNTRHEELDHNIDASTVKQWTLHVPITREIWTCGQKRSNHIDRGTYLSNVNFHPHSILRRYAHHCA